MSLRSLHPTQSDGGGSKVIERHDENINEDPFKMVAFAPVHTLTAGTLHLFGSAVLAGDYLGCLSGVRLGR